MEQVMTRCMVKTICIYRISAAKHQVFWLPSWQPAFCCKASQAAARRSQAGIMVCSSSTKRELVFY